MSSTETLANTSIELQSPPSAAAEQPDWNASTAPLDPDNIVEASRLADASVPDGGYGWVVVAACSLVTFLYVGTTYSWGVLQGALVEQGLSSPSTLAFVGSLAVACGAAFAIMNARLIRVLGARNVALLGITLMSLGQTMAGFSTKNVGGLFVTAGITMGLGVG
jgi:hypothetical protein